MLKQIYHRPALIGLPADFDWTETLRQFPMDPETHKPLLDAAISLLDGSHSLEEIVGGLLLGGFHVRPITAVLKYLERDGLLQESTRSSLSALPPEERGRYHTQARALTAMLDTWEESDEPLSEAGYAAQKRLKESLVVVAGLGPSGAHLIHALAQAGVGHIVGVELLYHETPPAIAGHDWDTTPQRLVTGETVAAINPFVRYTGVAYLEDLPEALLDAQPNLLVYAEEDFDPALCEQLNAVCLQAEIPLLPFRRQLFSVEIGPFVIAKQTACYACAELRRKGLALDASREIEKQDQPRLNFPLGVDWVALEAVKWITGMATPITRNRVWELNVMEGSMTLHPVLKLPRCPACGVNKVRPSRKLWEEARRLEFAIPEVTHVPAS